MADVPTTPHHHHRRPAGGTAGNPSNQPVVNGQTSVNSGDKPCLAPAKGCVQCDSPAVLRVYDVMCSPTSGLAQGSRSNGGPNPQEGSEPAEGARTNGTSGALGSSGLIRDLMTVGVSGAGENFGLVESSGLSRGFGMNRDVGLVEGAGPSARSQHHGGVGLAQEAEPSAGSRINDGTGFVGSVGRGEGLATNKSTQGVENAGFSEKSSIKKSNETAKSAGLGDGSGLRGVGSVGSSGLGRPSEVKRRLSLGGASMSNGVLSKNRLAEIMKSPSWRRGQSLIDTENLFPSEEETDVLDSKELDDDNTSLLRTQTNRTKDITIKSEQNSVKSDACIFIANLNSASTDEDLKAAIDEVFGKFGLILSINIKRNVKHDPFAFCLFENGEVAKKARVEGHDTLILGRNCRVEPSKACRSAYLLRRDGETIPEAEAGELLAPYGEIESMWRSSAAEREVFTLSEGLWVKFALHDQRGHAIKALKGSKIYRLEPLMPRSLNAVIGESSTPVAGARNAHHGSAEYMRKTNAESLRTTIFVGNLAEHILEPDLLKAFRRFGEIKEIVKVARYAGTVSAKTIHAFIEFAEPNHAARAVSYKGINIRGKRLRIEFKLDNQHPITRTPRGRHAGNPAKIAFANHQRQIHGTVGTNGVYGSAFSLGSIPGGVLPVAPGPLLPTGYYLGNGMAYESLGPNNPNLGNGPTTAMYGQGGISAPNGGPNAFNGSYGISPLGFPHIVSYSPAGYHRSAYVYHPNGQTHGSGGQAASSGGH